MALKIVSKPITENTNDFVKSTTYALVNSSIEAMSKYMKGALKDIECPTHKKDCRGTITIKPNSSKNNIEAKYSSFCCEEFKRIVKIKN